MEKLLCGVDIGGTKLSVGLVKIDGRVMDKIVVYDHTSKSEDDIINQIGSLIRELLRRNSIGENHLLGIGVGFAGHLRFKEGIVITSSNFKNKFKDFPIRDAIKKHFSGCVVVDNDANAQAYAEYKFGAGVGYDSLIFLTISTGIGAGLILDGKIYRGMTGTAGEFGHTIVNPHSDIKCGCGNYGCLMSHASGLALPNIVKKKLQQGIKTSLHFDCSSDLESIAGETLKKGLEINDELSKMVVFECADYIGIGLYNLFQIFNPPAIVLGGGLINWGSIFVDRIKEKFYSLARDMLFDKIDIVLAKMVGDAGLIGSAALLLEKG